MADLFHDCDDGLSLHAVLGVGVKSVLSDVQIQGREVDVGEVAQYVDDYTLEISTIFGVH